MTHTYGIGVVLPDDERHGWELLDASARRVAIAVGVVTELVTAERGGTPVLVSLARAGTPIGVLAAADTLRPESAQAVAALKALGVETVMLTGDNPATARVIELNPSTWAKSRTRLSSRFAMRGVPRDRRAISMAPSSSVA